MNGLKYQFYTSIGKSEDKKPVSAKAVSDCLTLYPFFSYKDFTFFAEDDLNQYVKDLIKRFFDLFISSIALITGSPFFALLVIITKLTSGGDVIYRQERIGKNGVPFYIYNFRTFKN